MRKFFPLTPPKPGVLTGETFSHTPDEARSVGLAKACVLQKIYSVLEKISYKYIIHYVAVKKLHYCDVIVLCYMTIM